MASSTPPTASGRSRGALRLVLRGVLALDLQDERGAGLQLHEEVGPVLAHDAVEHVDDLEAQVIVLGPGDHVRVTVEGEGLARLPRAVEDTPVDVRALGIGP